MDKNLIFLGGTCGKNNWREPFIAELVNRGIPPESLFNPVVPNWTPEDAVKEAEAKTHARSLIFYIADPMQEGNPISAYSLVEATMALYDNPVTTVVVFDKTGLTGHPLKAINQTEKDLKRRFPDAAIFGTPAEAIDWLEHDISR